MNNQKIRSFGVLALVIVWALLAFFLWFGPRMEVSEAERRPLAQMPALTGETLLNGKFMSQFEDFTLDQFPLRDSFRQVKSLFHYYVLGQKDNNGIYLADGYAVKQEYPYHASSVEYALDRFNHLYEKYLRDSGGNVFMTIVPDKGYYLAEPSGNLTLEYEAMITDLRAGMPWAEYVDITGDISPEDYYRTDTHWRQEKILDVARRLCEALGVEEPDAGAFTPKALERPFYGVYYGQAALPMKPETMYVLESEMLKNCTVYDWETGKSGSIYDESKLDSRDLYDVFLSGSRSLLTIENPAAENDRELIVFRDSFGSSIVPLLVQGYARGTLVDVRYIQIDMLDRFLEFKGQDVLFLYSTLVLNNSSTIK